MADRSPIVASGVGWDSGARESQDSGCEFVYMWMISRQILQNCSKST